MIHSVSEDSKKKDHPILLVARDDLNNFLESNFKL